MRIEWILKGEEDKKERGEEEETSKKNEMGKQKRASMHLEYFFMCLCLPRSMSIVDVDG